MAVDGPLGRSLSRLLLNMHAKTCADRDLKEGPTIPVGTMEADSICLRGIAPITGGTGQLPRSSQLTYGAARFTGVAIDAVAQRTHGKSASNWRRNEDHQRNASVLATGHTVPMG